MALLLLKLFCLDNNQLNGATPDFLNNSTLVAAERSDGRAGQHRGHSYPHNDLLAEILDAKAGPWEEIRNPKSEIRNE